MSDCLSRRDFDPRFSDCACVSIIDGEAFANGLPLPQRPPDPGDVVAAIIGDPAVLAELATGLRGRLLQSSTGIPLGYLLPL